MRILGCAELIIYGKKYENVQKSSAPLIGLLGKLDLACCHRTAIAHSHRVPPTRTAITPRAPRTAIAHSHHTKGTAHSHRAQPAHSHTAHGHRARASRTGIAQGHRTTPFDYRRTELNPCSRATFGAKYISIFRFPCRSTYEISKFKS